MWVFKILPGGAKLHLARGLHVPLYVLGKGNGITNVIFSQTFAIGFYKHFTQLIGAVQITSIPAIHNQWNIVQY